MNKYIFLYLLFILFSPGCESSGQTDISPQAKAYITEVIDLLKNRSVKRNEINWQDFEMKVIKMANGSKTTEDAYPAISYAINLLGDGHSYFAPARASEPSSEEEEKAPPLLPDEIPPADIGYIRVRYCMGDSIQTRAYISDLLSRIRKMDRVDLKGWIVDLRGNFGGNMWPMIAGTGPILGEGTAGYFTYPDGKEEAWGFMKNQALADTKILESSDETYVLKKADPYVAVLTDTLTASSGEAMAVSFKGRNKTKSFGQRTFGVSTGNNSHTLSDGSRINLTESIFADRNKNKYGSHIYPDLECGPTDAVTEAIKWIREAAH